MDVGHLEEKCGRAVVKIELKVKRSSNYPIGLNTLTLWKPVVRHFLF